MKTTYKVVFVFLFALSFGCTVHITPEKFKVDPALIHDFKSDVPIKILVPENAEKEYLIEFSGTQKSHGKAYVDLNDLYKNAKELMEEEINFHNVPLSADAEKYLSFTIQKIQWEVWAGGFSIGSYLYFTIETGDGYKKNYRVQDQSGMDVGRAVSGTITRAVEKIFQDKEVLAYIEGAKNTASGQ